MLSVLDILLGLGLGAVAAFFVAVTFCSVNTDGKFRQWDEETGKYKFAGNALGLAEGTSVVSLGLLFAVSWFLPPLVVGSLWGLNVLLYVLLMIAFISFIVYGCYEVSCVLEVLPLVVVSWWLWLFSKNVAMYIPADVFMGSVVNMLPVALLVLSIGIYFIRWLFIRAKYVDEKGSGMRLLDKVGAWVIKVFTVALVSVVCVNCVAWGKFQTPQLQKAHAEEVEEAQSDLKVKMTSEDLEKLSVAKYAKTSRVFDDSSLVPHDAERTKKVGCSDALAYPCTSFADIEDSVMRNPSFLKTLCDFFRDKQIGSKKIGDINPWMKDFSQLTEKNGIFYWCEWADESETLINVTDDYRLYGAMMNAFLERFINQGVQQRTTVENWCLSATSLNNKRWGVLADYQYTDDFIVLAWVGKNERGKENATGLFVFGFNIHDRRPAIFGDEPEVVTVTEPSGTPSDGGPSGTPSNGGPSYVPQDDEPKGSPQDDEPKGSPQDDKPSGDTPKDDKPSGDTPKDDKPSGDTPKDDKPEGEGVKDDSPQFDKDPSDGTPAKSGEADENTNNPSDPDHSKADTSDSSTSMDHEQYRKEMEQKEEINKNQREAGDSNESSTEKPSENANVDNAGAEAANNASKQTNEAKTADGSAVTKPEKSGGDGAWGGPKD